ncbi:MAG: aspartate--tRNA(Asn) ligase [Candidatus Thermoplasmatota archaeon]|nr:aspartate--tRNA(Asn) ligase [Candidatus Thermoplasmatota archaeon]
MLRTCYSRDVGEKEFGKTITIAGWVEDIRNLGGIAFILLRDKKGKSQVTCIKKENPELFEKITSIPRESVISVKGLCQKNEKVMNGWELLPREMKILSCAETPLPMGIADKVNVDFDTRLDNRFIDLRREKVQAIFRIRHTFIEAASDFLSSHGFVQVHTPKITVSSPEGGTEVFKINYFGRDAYLVQSPQLYKQILMATGMDRVYEVAWYFRAEEHDTSKHLNESTAMDVEMAFIESEEDVMQVGEKMVEATLEKITEEREKEIELLDADIHVPQLPFTRIKYDEVVEILEKHTEFKWGDDLGTDEEKMIGKELGEDFYFIIRFPLKTKPFYAMPDGQYAKAFDLECNGTEISSGAQRIHDYNMLKNRIVELGMNVENFNEYLKAFRYGMPPHGGFGFGIERFLMEALNLGNVRECILFPRDKKRISP